MRSSQFVKYSKHCDSYLLEEVCTFSFKWEKQSCLVSVMAYGHGALEAGAVLIICSTCGGQLKDQLGALCGTLYTICKPSTSEMRTTLHLTCSATLKVQVLPRLALRCSFLGTRFFFSPKFNELLPGCNDFSVQL